MLNKIKILLIRIAAKFFGNKGEQGASKESIAIVYNLSRRFGEVTSKVMLQLIYQFPSRAYYKLWFFPDHKTIYQSMNLLSQEYYSILVTLENDTLIKKQKDKKTKKLMYQIGFDRLLQYEKGVPASRIKVTV